MSLKPKTPNRLWKFLRKYSFAAAFLVLCFPASAMERQSAVVQQALSGDTVRLAGGKILRYASLQAPSLESKIELVREYAQQSLEFNKNLVEGKKIGVEWGSRIRDDQNNLIGVVFLENGTCVNLEILKAGHAKAVVQPPNLKYAADFRQAELMARRNKSGFWVKTPENPFIRSEYIGEVNTKIYYFPTSPELDSIPAAHLIRFDSRVAAVAAGYRPCRACHEDEVMLI